MLASTRVMRDVSSKLDYEDLLEGSWPDVLQLNAASQPRIGCHACMDGACKSKMPNVRCCKLCMREFPERIVYGIPRYHMAATRADAETHCVVEWKLLGLQASLYIWLHVPW